ncbi:MAG: carboxypeptidase-like regulatory domain-containing protein [Crocinitomicaceae bacterium]
MWSKVVVLIVAISFSAISFGQGIIRGKVTDNSNSAPIPFAKVKIQGLNAGANTDFDGEYQIKIEPGTYELVFSMSSEGFIDFTQEVTITDSEVKIINASLSKDQKVIEIGEMQVSANKIEGAKTVAADDARRRDEKGATEGVTTEQMKERGVTTAVEAVQMAPGLSIEDGKSVYVRGLGDRYTKTILNGMDLPGLDPDRNSVQMDIFPATIIDNITVYKTFTPNLSGDFTGGLVDITTKDFPSERTLYFSAGLGYNTATTFNKDYFSYKGGKLDFLAFDDGTRTLPINEFTKLSNPVLGESSLETATRQFNPTMATEQSSNFLNQNYSISYGDRMNFKKSKAIYGYNVVANYRNTHNYYKDVTYSEFRKVYDDNGNPINELDKWRQSTGSQTENDVIWTALVGQSIRINRSKVSLTLFHTQNGKSSAAQLTDVNYEQNPSTMFKQSLQYSQRSVSNANLSGRHFLDSVGKWKMDWKLSPTYSLIKDPDIRSTALEVRQDSLGNDQFFYTPAVGSEIRRIWRALKEYNLSGRVDLSKKFNYSKLTKNKRKTKLSSFAGREREFSFGVLNTYKSRSFEVLDYIFDVENPTSLSGDPNWYFESENIWTPESDTGTFVRGNKEPANTYDAQQNILGAYLMNEAPLTDRFTATYGVRVENAQNWYTGQNNTGSIKYNKELVLNELSILPSVNMVYKIEKKADSVHYARYTNIRAAYATTVARPSFKEKSIAQIYDPIQGRTFNGNIDLKQTTIYNADLRWEYFFGRTELISASAFYKRFIDPIELIAYNSAPNETQPLNSGAADIYGAEIEMRKAIGFNKKGKEHLSFMVGANFTYVISKIDMNQVKITTGGVTQTEKEIREINKREGETIGNYRAMYGQSPYIINAFVSFRNDSLGLTCNLSYNVQGKKLAVIGVGSLPDVYEQPFHSLNLKVSKTLGKERRWNASITASNLLMSVRQKHYESYNAESQVYDYFNQGMTISGSVAYTLEGRKKK